MRANIKTRDKIAIKCIEGKILIELDFRFTERFYEMMLSFIMFLEI